MLILGGIAVVRGGGKLPVDSEVIGFNVWRGSDQDFSTHLEENWNSFLELLDHDKVLAANKDNAQTRYNRAWKVWVIGQNKLALADAEILVRSVAENPRVQELYAACLNSNDRPADGLKVTEKALTLHPGDLGLLRFRSEAQFMLGQYEPALLTIDQAIQGNRNLWVFWNLKSAILQKLQRFDEAKQAADEVIRLRRKPQN
jgi:tetratricopeptide (TPR) repeat protein